MLTAEHRNPDRTQLARPSRFHTLRKTSRLLQVAPERQLLLAAARKWEAA